MIVRFVKPFCQIAASCLPHSSEWRRMVVPRAIKHRFAEYLFSTERPLMLAQFADGKWRDARRLVFGSSHVQYGFDPGESDVPAWNMGVSNCDLRTMCFLVEKALEKGARPEIAVFIDFWMRSLQLEYSRDFAVSSVLDSLGLVPLRRRFLAEYWRRRAAAVVPSPVPPGMTFRNGFWAGRKHWSASVEFRIGEHLGFMEHEPTELVWLDRMLVACERNGVSPLVVIPPMRQDYLALLAGHGDLFAEYRTICKSHGVDVVDFFSGKDFSEDDFGDADHLNGSGAAKMAKILNGVFGERKD